MAYTHCGRFISLRLKLRHFMLAISLLGTLVGSQTNDTIVVPMYTGEYVITLKQEAHGD